MMFLSRRTLLLTGAAVMAGCGAPAAQARAAYLTPDAGKAYAGSSWRALTAAQWRERLPDLAFDVLRREGTERPGTSPLNEEKRNGVFSCLGCGLDLFRSDRKFESGTGWPSFYEPIKGALETKTDRTAGMVRVEYHCARCLGHQGHVFEDGPPPTGLRYCNNGAALKFTPA